MKNGQQVIVCIFMPIFFIALLGLQPTHFLTWKFSHETVEKVWIFVGLSPSTTASLTLIHHNIICQQFLLIFKIAPNFTFNNNSTNIIRILCTISMQETILNIKFSPSI